MFEDDEIEDFDQFEEDELEFFDKNEDNEEADDGDGDEEEDVSEKTIDEIVSEIIINIELLEAILLDVMETNEKLRKELEKYRGDQNSNDPD